MVVTLRGRSGTEDVTQDTRTPRTGLSVNTCDRRSSDRSRRLTDLFVLQRYWGSFLGSDKGSFRRGVEVTPMSTKFRFWGGS